MYLKKKLFQTERIQQEHQRRSQQGAEGGGGLLVHRRRQSFHERLPGVRVRRRPVPLGHRRGRGRLVVTSHSAGFRSRQTCSFLWRELFKNTLIS